MMSCATSSPREPNRLAGRAAADLGLDMHFQNIGAILDCWGRGEEAPTSGPEARKAVAIILAMYESSRKGGVPITVM